LRKDEMRNRVDPGCGGREQLPAPREKIVRLHFPGEFIAYCREVGVEVIAPIRLIY
jgi:hypothetical protein